MTYPSKKTFRDPPLKWGWSYKHPFGKHLWDQFELLDAPCHSTRSVPWIAYTTGSLEPGWAPTPYCHAAAKLWTSVAWLTKHLCMPTLTCCKIWLLSFRPRWTGAWRVESSKVWCFLHFRSRATVHLGLGFFSHFALLQWPFQLFACGVSVIQKISCDMPESVVPKAFLLLEHSGVGGIIHVVALIASSSLIELLRSLRAFCVD